MNHTVIVTFVGHDYTEGLSHDVRLTLANPLSVAGLDGDAVAELAWEAAGEWPESGWGTNTPRWWAKYVTLPDGTRVDMSGRRV